MAFKSIEHKREYQRQWIAEKRARAKADKKAFEPIYKVHMEYQENVLGQKEGEAK